MPWCQGENNPRARAAKMSFPCSGLQQAAQSWAALGGVVLTHVEESPPGGGGAGFALVNKVVIFVLGKRQMFTKKPPRPCQDEQAAFQPLTQMPPARCSRPPCSAPALGCPCRRHITNSGTVTGAAASFTGAEDLLPQSQDPEKNQTAKYRCFIVTETFSDQENPHMSFLF